MIDHLLEQLEHCRVRVWAEGGRLRYRAPAGALTDELAAAMRAHREELLDRLSGPGAACTAIPRAPAGAAPVVSFAQQRMWLAWKMAPRSAAYNVAFVVKLSGRLDVDALRAGVHRIIARHAVLRTRFRETPHGVVPVVLEAAPDAAVEIRHLDLVDEPPARREQALQRLLSEQSTQPFDLAAGAPLQVTLYPLGATTHWLFVRLHHIIADASSIGILLRELACFDRPDIARPDEGLQYSDFAAWERRRLEGSRRAHLLEYWSSRLAGDIETLELPTDRPRPRMPSTRGARFTIELPASLCHPLLDLGRSLRATPFMVFLAGLRIILHRYSGQSDFLIGAPTILRDHPGTEALIGYFGNTLALRNPVTRRDSYLDVLAREREGALAAYEHQELPFEEVVARLRPDRSLDRSPLFRVMFSWLDGEVEAEWPAGLSVEVAEVETASAKFDLLLTAQAQRGGGALVVIEYAADLFHGDTIARFALHMKKGLEDMARRPEASIGDRSLLTGAEEHTILAEWNATERPLPSVLLHHLFAAQASVHPDRVAIYAGAEEVTYRQLGRLAERIARRLRAEDLRREELVAVCLRRTPHLMAALLGVLEAGGAYVPIDPAYPSARIHSILEDCGARITLTERGLLAQASAWGRGRVLVIDEPDESDGGATLVEEVALGPVAVDDDPRRLAYVLYTSGSTGQPKGALIEHRSVVNLVRWAHRHFSDEELAGVLAATSISFDLSAFELFVPLCGGHSVILADDALGLAGLPARARITLINSVPTVMRALLQGAAQSIPPSLRVVNLAGEPLDTALVDDIYRHTTARTVYDLYGPTEATTYATCARRAPGAPPTIGRPIDNLRCYLLDETGLPVPPGVMGEIYLAGVGLARGYLRRPELQAERFVSPRRPTIREPVLYRTGDLARFTPNGELVFLGRNDDQLKVRGFRIEPAEVRAALLDLDGVEDAWVATERGSDGDARLSAWVVGAPERTEPASLRRLLRETLPEHLVPSVIRRVSRLPTTPSGKIDSNRLWREAATGDEAAPPAALATPTGETELRIAAIWRELLGVERLDATANFFDLGGHSLTAMRATARLGEAFGVDLPLRLLFQHPTVQELAEALAAAGAGCRSSLPPIEPRGRDHVPATLLQTRIAQLHRLAADPAYLNIATCISLRGGLDLEVALLALTVLGERHPVLRSVFGPHGGGLWQRAAPGQVPTYFLDCGTVRDEDEERRKLALAQSEAGRALDIFREGSARFVIVRLGPEHHVVILVVHHIVADDWSLRVLDRDFTRCLSAFLEGGPTAALPEAPPRFFDYATWETECLGSGLFERSIMRWRDALGPPLPPLRFPFRCGPEDAVESCPVVLDGPLTEALQAPAHRHHASLFVVLLSVFARLSAQLSGESDIRIATNIAARHRRGVGDMVGPLTDTVILRQHVPPAATAFAALGRAHQAFIEACGGDEAPFEAVAERLLADRGVERAELAQVFFLFQEDAAPLRGPTGMTAENSPIEAQADYFKVAAHNYDLVLYLYRTTDGLRGQFTVRAPHDDGELLRGIVRRFRELAVELMEVAGG